MPKEFNPEYQDHYDSVIGVFRQLNLNDLSPNTLKLINTELEDVLMSGSIGNIRGEIFRRVILKVAGINMNVVSEVETNRKSFWEKINQKLASY